MARMTLDGPPVVANRIAHSRTVLGVLSIAYRMVAHQLDRG